MMCTGRSIADMQVCFVYICVHVDYLVPGYKKSDGIMMVTFLDENHHICKLKDVLQQSTFSRRASSRRALF